MDVLGGNIQLTFTWIVSAAITLKPLHRNIAMKRLKWWFFFFKIEDSYVISLNNNLTIPISTVTVKFPMHSNVVEYSKKKIVQNEFAFFNALEWRKLLMMRFNELVKRTKPHTRIIRNSRQLQFQFTRLNWKLKSICNEKNPVLMLVMYSKKNLGMA